MSSRYRHIITLCCFLMMFVNLGFCNSSFSVYQPYIVAQGGVGDAGGSLVITVRTLSVLVVMAAANVYYQKLGLRFGVALASAFCAAAFITYSRSTTLLGYCAGAVLAGCSVGLGTMIAISMLLNRWHPDNVGTAIGIASTGSAVGSVVIPPIATLIIHGQSLATSFLIEGLFAAVIAVLLFALVRPNPTTAQRAGGSDAPARSRKAPNAGHKPLSARAHRLMGVGLFCLGMMTYSGLAYLAVLMTDEGFDPVFVAGMLSLCGALLAVSKFATGFIFDHLGTRKGSLIFYAITLVGLVCCVLTPLRSTPVAVVAAALYGLGNGISSTGVSVWSIELADPGNADRSIRNFQLCFSLGGFCFTIFPGLIKVAFGTYAIAYGVMFAGCLISGIIVSEIYRRYRPGR